MAAACESKKQLFPFPNTAICSLYSAHSATWYKKPIGSPFAGFEGLKHTGSASIGANSSF